jgi:hypothetical protein
MISVEVAERQTRITGHTRLEMSMTVRTQRRRRSKSSSYIQSMLGPGWLQWPVLRSSRRVAIMRSCGTLSRICNPSTALEADLPIIPHRMQVALGQNGSAKTSLVTHFKCQPDKIGGSLDTQLSLNNGTRVGDGLVGNTQ